MRILGITMKQGTPSERALYIYGGGDWPSALASVSALPRQPRELIDRVNVSFAAISDAGDPVLIPNDLTPEVASEVHTAFPNATLAVAFGGGDELDSTKWMKAFGQPEAFSERVLEISSRLGAAAVIADCEAEVDPEKYASFIYEVAGRLGSAGVSMTVALGRDLMIQERFNVRKVSEVARLDVMSYDQFGPWSAEVGPLATTDWATIGMMGYLFIHKVPFSQVAAGVPFYGYRYDAAQPGEPVKNASALPMPQIEALYLAGGWHFDLFDGTTYMVKDDGSQLISYVTPAELTDRIEAFETLGVRSFFGWQAVQATPTYLTVFTQNMARE